MAEVSESEKRAKSSSSRSSSTPSRHDTDVQNPLTPVPYRLFLRDLRKWVPHQRLSERASGGMPEEIAIYEAFFESSFREGTHSAPVEGECNVLQAHKLSLEQRRVTHLLSPEVLRRSKLWEDTGEGKPEDPMVAFKKATDAISARRDSFSRNASGDGAATAGNKRRMRRT
ncbi:Uncharacterized protein Rs2_41010 [Raphanus sativus]|nr:Uncharacterized protein Rs2_41010 [Raphanus sativus]